MSVASVEELRAAFESSNFERILETRESTWVDFKSSSYHLDANRGVWELCKDVAAFANVGGGCVVIGVEAEKDPDLAVERAVKLTPLSTTVANRERYRDLLNAWITPAIEGLSVVAYPSSEGKCFLVVYVPLQSVDMRPFLVKYLVDLDGKRVSGFGWPFRADDGVQWQSCEFFQNRLSIGGLIQTALAQARAPQLAREPPAPRFVEPTAEMLGRFARVVAAMQVQAPALIYQFTPLETVDLTARMYGQNGLATAVRARAPLRARGFNVVARGDADVRSPTGIEWGARWRTAVDVDGICIAAAPATDDSLARTARTPPNGPIVNPVFLLEWTNDVMRMFYELVLPSAGVGVDRWRLTVIAIGMQQGRVRIPRRDPQFLHDDELARATSDDYRRDLALTGDAGRDTYAALVRFYALFGVGPERIPFIADDAFDPSAFEQATRR